MWNKVKKILLIILVVSLVLPTSALDLMSSVYAQVSQSSNVQVQRPEEELESIENSTEEESTEEGLESVENTTEEDSIEEELEGVENTTEEESTEEELEGVENTTEEESTEEESTEEELENVENSTEEESTEEELESVENPTEEESTEEGIPDSAYIENEELMYYINHFSLVSESTDLFVDVPVFTQNNEAEITGPVSIPSGLITDSIANLEMGDEVAFERAVVLETKSDGTQQEIAEIIRIGAFKGSDENDITFYATENDEDTGIKLEDNQQIVLIFKTVYNVNYQVYVDGKETSDFSDYGALQGPDTVLKGSDLILNVSTKEYKTVEVKYKIGDGEEQKLDLISGSGKIAANAINNHVTVIVKFATNETYTITSEGSNASISYSDSAILEENKQSYVEHDNTSMIVKVGKPISLVVYTEKWQNWNITNNDKYTLNSVIINGEEVELPKVNPEKIDKVEDIHKSVITRLTDNTEVTVTLEGIITEGYIAPTQKTKYVITISPVKNDLYIKLSSRQHGNYQVAFSGMRGIEKVAVLESSKRTGNNKNYYLTSTNDNNVYQLTGSNKVISDGSDKFVYFYNLKPGYNPNQVTAQSYHDQNPNSHLINPGTVDKILDIQDQFEGSFGAVPSQAKQSGFNYAFIDLTNKEYRSQYVVINAMPYNYQVKYDLNEGTMYKSSMPEGLYYYSSSTEYEVTGTIYENKVRTVEDSYLNVVMPKDSPVREGYIFTGWELVGSNQVVLKPNESFSLNEEYLNYSTRRDDDNLLDDTNNVFTLKAKWLKKDELKEQVMYKVEYYKENPANGTVSVDGKKYDLYYSSVKTGVKDSSVISLDTKYPGDGYVLNETNSVVGIEKLQDNATIVYYYDLKPYEFTLNSYINDSVEAQNGSLDKPQSVSLGDIITYELNFINPTMDSLDVKQNAYVEFNLPAGLELMPSEGIYDENTRTIKFDVSTINSGDNKFQIVAKVVNIGLNVGSGTANLWDSSYEVITSNNVYHQASTVDLTIAKQVFGDFADLTRTYDIQIKLFKDENNLFNGSVNSDIDTINFVNGEATVSLKHGETITLKGLPVGYSYEVSESTNPYSISYSGDRTGILDSNKSVTVIGTLNTIPVTGFIHENSGPVWMVVGLSGIGLLLFNRRRGKIR